jgi:hypothetical protein
MIKEVAGKTAVKNSINTTESLDSKKNITATVLLLVGKNETKDLVVGGGPPPFCESDYILYRSSMRDIICSSSGILPEAESSNIIFLHVPKTGGESLEAALQVNMSHEVQQTRQREYYEDSPHVVITIVRNPFARMRSWFRFCLHGYRGTLLNPVKHCHKAHELINAHAGRHDAQSIANAFEQWIYALTVGEE